jgi:deazaflavin-dependent oxidoreductase (nitroreductase family)
MRRAGTFNTHNIEEFRKNHGKVGGWFEGTPLLLIHTFGRRTGKERVNPVMYLKDGERYLVFASNGGADKHPDWFLNLKAHPDIPIEVGDDNIGVHAAEVTGQEHDALYKRQATLYPQFGDYQRRTKRIIPVIALTKKKRETHDQRS